MFVAHYWLFCLHLAVSLLYLASTSFIIHFENTYTPWISMFLRLKCASFIFLILVLSFYDVDWVDFMDDEGIIMYDGFSRMVQYNEKWSVVETWIYAFSDPAGIEHIYYFVTHRCDLSEPKTCCWAAKNYRELFAQTIQEYRKLEQKISKDYFNCCRYIGGKHPLTSKFIST